MKGYNPHEVRVYIGHERGAPPNERHVYTTREEALRSDLWRRAVLTDWNIDRAEIVNLNNDCVYIRYNSLSINGEWDAPK